MSMGFPQSTYNNEYLKTNTTKKFQINKKLLKTNISVECNNLNESKSFVEMITNYVIKLFFEEFINQKTLAMNCIKPTKTQLEAIKNENDIIIG
jgi:hypothetical protein